jgi:hypothetical protein
MSVSKSIGIGLIALMGASFAVSAKAAVVTKTTTTKTVVTSVKQQPKKAKVAVRKKVLKPVAKKSVAVAKKPVALTPPPAVVAAPSNTLAVTVPTEPKKEEEKPWSIGLSADFSPENDVQTDSSALYAMTGTYKFNKYHKVFFLGRMIQTFVPETGKEDAPRTKTIDPRFEYTYSLSNPDDKNLKVELKFRSAPGWSEGSQENGVKAVNTVRIHVTKPLGDFSISTRPYLGHMWTEYAVNAKNEPLPLFIVGHDLILTYKITENLSWCLDIDTQLKMLQPEEVKTVAAMNATPPSGEAPKVAETVKTALAAGTELGYKFSKTFAARLGYAQEDGLIADGRYSLNMFDRKSSRYYVGVDLSF